MTPEQIIFLIVAGATLVSGLMVVTSHNLIHAALWLVATLFVPRGVEYWLPATVLFAAVIFNNFVVKCNCHSS